MSFETKRPAASQEAASDTQARPIYFKVKKMGLMRTNEALSGEIQT
jgi:hypothetical protein